MRQQIGPIVGWLIGTGLAVAVVAMFVPPHSEVLAVLIGGLGAVGGLFVGTVWQNLHDYR